ncbi:MAG: hypothetical protein ACI9NC_001834 [Verrucomicrobiales bacterium]|jgi:hypothetical protein
MTVGFMALTVAILAEFIDPHLERILLLRALAVGFASVVYWYYARDLRFYYWVQSLPILCIPAAIILLPKTHERSRRQVDQPRPVRPPVPWSRMPAE